MLHTWTERRCLLKLKGSTLVHIQTRGIKKSKHYRKRPSRDDESDESESDTDESDSDTDDSDDLSDDDDSENVFAVDNDAPSVYSEMVINTMRADRVAIKGLKLTNSEFIDTFYASKVLKNGKLLIKKGQKLRTNDKVDVVINQTPGKLKVKRVKILAVIDDRSMSTGTVRIRVWRLPFEIPAPPGWKI